MKVFIQNEAGSFSKNTHNEKTLEAKATARVSRAYPWPYGFVLNTTGDDNLNVDCYVLTNKTLHTGEIVDCIPIALMQQIEDGKDDHNVLAVLRGESVRPLDSGAKQILTEFVMHVFDHIQGKQIRVGEFQDEAAARRYVESHRDQ